MKPSVTILYVEDNEDYIAFVERAIRKLDVPVKLHAITDGHLALDYLKSSDDNQKQFKLVLLDINLPGITGIELLQKIRSNDNMSITPVIMFSTSDDPHDVKKSYRLGANAYVVKPLGLEPLTNSLKSICNFWLGHNYAQN